MLQPAGRSVGRGDFTPTVSAARRFSAWFVDEDSMKAAAGVRGGR
jgi:hypothetical protein